MHEVVDWAPFPIATLSTDLALVNHRRDSLQLSYGACALELEAHESRDVADPRAWQSWAVQAWPSSVGRGCLAYLAIPTVAPGDTLRPSELRSRIRLAEIRQ